MKTDAVRVRALNNYCIEVSVQDERIGRFDMTPYLDNGLFKRLREPGYFARVAVRLGAVCWPDGQDIAPDTLMAGMQLQSVERVAGVR